MKAITHIHLARFEFWAGALALSENLTIPELEQIESCLEDIFHDKIPTETEINELFWHEPDFICSLIGEDYEDIINREWINTTNE